MAQLSAGSDDACISDALIGKFAQEFYYQFINVSEGTLIMESGMVVDSKQSVCPDCSMRLLGKTLYDRYRERHLYCDRCGTELAADARFCPPLRAVTVPESFCRLKDPARRSFTQQSE